ncbi:MAG: adenylyltransferase/cytidyltransferase family protein [Acidobacteriota bacterium]
MTSSPHFSSRFVARALEELVERRRRGASIALTYGSFELLHPGHLELLRRARELADCLVVAVRADAVIEQLEGPGRPFVPFAERRRLVGAIRWVDFAIATNSEHPVELIQSLQPEVVVEPSRRNGLDETQIDSWRGRLVTVELATAYSTRGLLALIQRLVPE